MKLTKGELEVLSLVGQSPQLCKEYFERFPPRRRRAKELMWRGYIEHTGMFAEYVKLTPAGQDELDKR